MIPDTVILVVSITACQLFELFHRYRVFPHIPQYTRLAYRDRFDWTRRYVNLTFQLCQCLFNLYLLFEPGLVDVIYHYSRFAHVGFLIITSFYIFDTCGMIMHPSWPSTTPIWITHHTIAIALLVYNTSYKQSSSFPSAVFLISAAAHIPNELRWFIAVFNIRSRKVVNFANVFCTCIEFTTLVLPPPYLLYRCARHLDVSIPHLFAHKMRFYCQFTFLLLYLPHVILPFYQLHRTYTHWNLPPAPFRPKKVE